MSEFAVIMAGGGGTRLWPISRRHRPKQSLALLGERTLFQQAVDRLAPRFDPEHILVVTTEAQADQLQAQTPELPADNFLPEPHPKGTASVIAYAAALLAARDPEAVMVCLTADHVINNAGRFRDVLGAAAVLAQEGQLVTLGITPTHASTAYGYIQLGAARPPIAGLEVHAVQAFREKPSAELAADYVESGDYRWNSGMFAWRADRILEEMARLMPDLHQGVLRIVAEPSELEEIWTTLEPQTIDYGVMERAREVSVIAADELGWWDVGSWDRLFDLVELDGEGNAVLARNALVMDTRGSLLYQDSDSDRLIASLGVENLIIVDTDDVLLVCAREEAEQVRRLVEALSNSELEDRT